jgi:aminoglycoside phosphotransferase (APT) family kinase protein
MAQLSQELCMSSNELDPIPILASLGISGATEISRVAGGSDTIVWRVVRGNDRFALRLFPLGEEQVCQREARMMALAAAAGIPVPTIHANAMWQERAVMLLSWCPGQQMAEALIARPTQGWKLGRAFGKMQARLNAIAVPADLAAECFDWIDWVGREERALQTRLRAEVGPRGLLHFDYHPQNVLVADGRISAVIDWSNATVGDSRADIARTYTILSVEPWPPALPWYIRLGRRILGAAWRSGYQQVAGPPGDMALYKAAAGAVMIRDLSPKMSQRPWLTPHKFAQLQQRVDGWKRQAGIESLALFILAFHAHICYNTPS